MQGPSKDKILVVYNQNQDIHASTRPHPQCPDRINSIVSAMKDHGKAEIIDYRQGIDKKQLRQTESGTAERAIEAAHGVDYREFIQQMWDPNTKKAELFINKDTYYMRQTYEAARQAVMTTLSTLDHLIYSKQSHYAYAVVRPPGHHSGMKSQPHGFSFFNNAGIAANVALESGKFERIAIVDWDVHHGQGTQHIFYERKDVLYLSLHRFDNGKFFPHVQQSGPSFTGKAAGQGHNINIAWNLPQTPPGTPPAQSVGDRQYYAAFEQIVMPVLSQYNPDLVIVSCGFDAGEGDRFGGLKVTKNGYQVMTEKLVNLGKKTLFVLEGGYHMDILQWGSKAILDVLSGAAYWKIDTEQEPNQIGRSAIEATKAHIAKYWEVTE